MKYKPSKKTTSGTLEPDEQKAFEAVQKNRGRRAAYIVRLAIVRLLADESAGRIDWTKGIEDYANQNGNAGAIKANSGGEKSN